MVCRCVTGSVVAAGLMCVVPIWARGVSTQLIVGIVVHCGVRLCCYNHYSFGNIRCGSNGKTWRGSNNDEHTVLTLRATTTCSENLMTGFVAALTMQKQLRGGF